MWYTEYWNVNKPFSQILFHLMLFHFAICVIILKPIQVIMLTFREDEICKWFNF